MAAAWIAEALKDYGLRRKNQENCPSRHSYNSCGSQLCRQCLGRAGRDGALSFQRRHCHDDVEDGDGGGYHEKCQTSNRVATVMGEVIEFPKNKCNRVTSEI